MLGVAANNFFSFFLEKLKSLTLSTKSETKVFFNTALVDETATMFRY